MLTSLRSFPVRFVAALWLIAGCLAQADQSSSSSEIAGCGGAQLRSYNSNEIDGQPSGSSNERPSSGRKRRSRTSVTESRRPLAATLDFVMA